MLTNKGRLKIMFTWIRNFLKKDKSSLLCSACKKPILADSKLKDLKPFLTGWAHANCVDDIERFSNETQKKFKTKPKDKRVYREPTLREPGAGTLENWDIDIPNQQMLTPELLDELFNITNANQFPATRENYTHTFQPGIQPVRHFSITTNHENLPANNDEPDIPLQGNYTITGRIAWSIEDATLMQRLFGSRVNMLENMLPAFWKNNQFDNIEIRELFLDWPGKICHSSFGLTATVTNYYFKTPLRRRLIDQEFSLTLQDIIFDPEQPIDIDTRFVYIIHLYKENTLIMLHNCLLIELEDHIDTLFIKGLYKNAEIFTSD